MPTSQADYQQIVIEALKDEIATDNPTSPHLQNPGRLRQIAGRIMKDLRDAGLIVTTEAVDLAHVQKGQQGRSDFPHVPATPFADHTVAEDAIAPGSIDSAL